MTKELSKQDALELMSLQFKVLSTEGDLRDLYRQRAAFSQELFKKYRVNPETHRFNIVKGCFEEIPEKPKLVEAGGKANG